MNPADKFEKDFGRVDPARYERSGPERQIPSPNELAASMPNSILKYGAAIVGVSAVLGIGSTVMGGAIDRELGVPGSADDKFCVSKDKIYDETYQSRLDAIRVKEGEFVSGSAVRIQENPDGTYQVLGLACA